MKYFLPVFTAVVFVGCSTVSEKEKLRARLTEIATSTDATVGVAIMDLSTHDTLILHGRRHFPMQSVYKLHLAMAVLHKTDTGKLALDQQIYIAKKDLLPDTHSPLRDDFPKGDTTLTLSKVLEYTVGKGDNNGCDILFRLLGGTEVVNGYIKNGLKIEDVAIAATEEEMHKSWDVQFTNWSTPASVLEVLERSSNEAILSQRSINFLWKIMVETPTGSKRLKGLLPAEAIVAHKTGYSGANSEGTTAAVNDVGIVQLQNGRRYAIAVFVVNTKEPLESSERIIAAISKAAWDYFNK